MDLENSGVISTEQLGTVMDGLAEENVIDDYTDGRQHYYTLFLICFSFVAHQSFPYGVDLCYSSRTLS